MKNIRETIKEYLKEDIAPFSMPGHKYGRAFKSKGADNMFDYMISGDITEVEGLDNLHHPEGIIKYSLDQLKKVYDCAGKSYFLINGSSSGNLAMIFSAFNEGDKVLVERGCHKSIFNAFILRKIIPEYIDTRINKDLYIPIPTNEEDLIESLDEHRDIKGLVITYPNYYGMCIDIDRVAYECRRRKITLIVDSAHGAHFGFSKRLPINAVSTGCDMVVESCHKTLPTLTQTAFLHVNNKSLVKNADFYVSTFSSTSPSYMFMLSMEYGYEFLRNESYDAYEKMYHKIKEIKSKINSMDLFTVVDKDVLNNVLEKKIYDFDFTRLVINVKKGCLGYRLAEYLRKNNVQCEMSDERNVVLICTPFNNSRDYDKLVSALSKCSEEDIVGESRIIDIDNKYEKIYEPFESVTMNKESVSLEDSKNRVCGDNIVIYPPGVPLVVIGEKITEDKVKIIKELMNMNVDILGVDDNNQVMVIMDK